MQAEDAGGGWVPLVFHEIENSGPTDSVTPADFAAFLDWLQPRAATGTIVKTVRSVVAPPSPVPQPPPASPVAADKVTAFASLSARSVQDIDRLYVKASMIEADADGKRQRGDGERVEVLPLQDRQEDGPPPRRREVEVKLAKRPLRTLKRALRRHKRLKAQITITARDKAGNVKTARRTVRLRN